MEITNIPFVRKLGLKEDPHGTIRLPFDESVQNHLQTMHAGAIFTLAETASGKALQQLFPDLADKVVPVLREAQVKYKRPATGTLTSSTSVSETEMAAFRQVFESKGRALIAVPVELKDPDELLIFRGVFSWFIQAIDY